MGAAAGVGRRHPGRGDGRPDRAGYTRPGFGVLRRLLEDPVELAAQVNQGGVRAVAARHRVTPAAAQAALTRSGYRARLRAGGHVWARTSA